MSFLIHDSHFSSIKNSNGNLIDIDGSAQENFSIQFCSFSYSECSMFLRIDKFLHASAKSTYFIGNKATFPWNFAPVEKVEYLSDLNSVNDYSAAVVCTNGQVVHSNFTKITANSYRTAICFESPQNKVAHHIIINDCEGPPLVSFHSSSEPSSISHFIFTGGQVSDSVFVFEKAHLTVTVEDSIFKEIGNLQQQFSQIADSSGCSISFSGCRSDNSIIPNANSSLSFGIRRGFLPSRCETLKPPKKLGIILLCIFQCFLEAP